MSNPQIEELKRLSPQWWPPNEPIERCTFLDCEKKQLSITPVGISLLINLIRLDLNDNQIVSIPEWISLLTKLIEMHLFNNQITSVPNGISRLTNLTFLRVDGNKITTIPDGISCLTGLKSTNWSNNQITSVPNEISRLTNLTFLRVDGNQITTIPDGISCLTGLNALQFNNNQITSVPNGISRLTMLTFFNIRHNQISVIPPCISTLTLLACLIVRNNPIEELPAEITCLKNLKELYIEDPEGNATIKRAPKGITALPCWSNNTRPDPIDGIPWKRTYAEALQRLSLYDPVEEARKVAEEQKRMEEERKKQQATKAASSTLSPRQQGNTPTSPLVGVKLADILSLDFKKKENVLGNGGFGLVFKVQLNAGTFAVKLIANAALHKDADSEKEGEMMLKLQHPNIIALYDFGYRGDDLLFIMECADGGDLCSLIKKNKALNQKEAMKYGLDIIQGLVYLHTRTPAIQHRDLKTENVLLVKGVAKLTDFGLSKSGASVNSASGFKGSIKWSPPEAFDFAKSMGLPSDVYSYGVVLWSMVTGEYPHEGLSEREVGKKVTDGPLPIPPSCPPGLAGLLKKCWEKDYEKRIKAIDVETLLKEVIENPNAVVSASSGSVITMNTAELVKYLEGKNALKKFIDAVRENEVSGEDFLELDEDALTSAPFSLPRLQTRVILRFVEEAKRT